MNHNPEQALSLRLILGGLFWLAFSVAYTIGIILFQIMGISWVNDVADYYVSALISLVFALLARLAFPRVKGYWWLLSPLFLPMGFMLLFVLEIIFLQPTSGSENSPLGVTGNISLLTLLAAYFFQIYRLVKAYPYHRASPSNKP